MTHPGKINAVDCIYRSGVDATAVFLFSKQICLLTTYIMFVTMVCVQQQFLGGNLRSNIRVTSNRLYFTNAPS